MSLPEGYLTYSKRAYGQDHDRYAWRLAKDRAPVALAQGAELAVMIVVPLEVFMLNPSGKPFKHPGAMVTPYPDLRHFTSRDYGNRVGAYRILRELKAAGLTATFAVNARLIGRIKPLIGAILADGHEIAAHGLDTDSLHWGGIDPETEKAFVIETRAAFAAEGLSPRAWMSPARQQSFATPDLIRAADFSVCLDWEMDTIPIALETAHGPVRCPPLSNELDDRKILIDQRQTEAEWRDQILEAASLLKSEYGRMGAQTLGFTLTPYITGLPFRIWALREVLQALASDHEIWCAGASAVADAFP